ncbi:MAG: hypothetical protein R3B13_14715 [Polyangiaceae bacterium]
MRRYLVGISLLTLGAGLAAGCGGDSDDGGGGAKSIAIEDVPPLYADAICTTFEGCFAGAPFEVFLNGEDCRKNYETALNDELIRIKTAVDGGSVVYKGNLMQKCLDAVKGLGCALQGEPPECQAAIAGTVEDGGDCTLDPECKGANSYCRVGSSCPGSCAPKEPAGASCRRNDDCAVGLQCSDTTQKCFAPAKDGETCGGGSAPDCGPGLFCVGEEESPPKSGTCADGAAAFSAAEGDPCFFNGKSLCKDGLFCLVTGVDTQTQQLVTECAKQYAAGADCSPGIPDACPIEQYCKVTPNTFTGVCTAKPGDGEACAAGIGGDASVCAPGTRCDGGTCRPRQKLGASCKTDEVCYSENCSGGACAPGGGCTI